VAVLLLGLGVHGSLASAAPGNAAPAEVLVSAPQVVLGDVAPHVPEAHRGTPLCASPPAHGSRLLTREEIRAALVTQNVKFEGSLPASVRVVRKMQLLSPKEIESLSAAALTGPMPKGATLKRVRALGPFAVPAGWSSAEVSLPKPPRRTGEHAQATSLILLRDGQNIATVPVMVEMQLSEAAARFDVPKGSSIQLTVQHGSVVVRAQATTLADGDVGSVVAVSVPSGKHLHARLESAERAISVEGRQ
jgi:hypothetical protein